MVSWEWVLVALIAGALISLLILALCHASWKGDGQ